MYLLENAGLAKGGGRDYFGRSASTVSRANAPSIP